MYLAALIRSLRVLSELCHLEAVLPVAQRGVVGGLRCARDLQEPLLPLTGVGLPLSQAKETDHPSSPGLTNAEALKDGFGKVRDKDRDEQTSFPGTAYCLAQNVPENHNLPFLVHGESLGNIFDSYRAIAWLFPVVPRSLVWRWC